jgi:serine/threonine protein kinase
MTRLGKYELQEEIGRGGFATVYRATHTALGSDAAVKVLDSNRLSDPRALYALAGNAAAGDLLARQGGDFRLRLRADQPLREGEYALLSVQVQNLGSATAHDLRLTCASGQLELPRKSHRFGNLAPGEERAWETLQARPKAGERGELLLQLRLAWRDAQGKNRRLRQVFRRGGGQMFGAQMRAEAQNRARFGQDEEFVFQRQAGSDRPGFQINQQQMTVAVGQGEPIVRQGGGKVGMTRVSYSAARRSQICWRAMIRYHSKPCGL